MLTLQSIVSSFVSDQDMEFVVFLLFLVSKQVGIAFSSVLRKLFREFCCIGQTYDAWSYPFYHLAINLEL